MANEPIEPQDYLSGTTVVDIGDIRVARGLTRRPASTCKHPRLHYDQKERRIWCPDCERDIDPFDAFLHIVEPYDAAYKRLQRMRAEIIEAQECALHSIAAKKLDEAWRRRKMVPTCPCCGHGLLPEDFRSGCSVVGRDFAIARRRGLAKER